MTRQNGQNDESGWDIQSSYAHIQRHLSCSGVDSVSGCGLWSGALARLAGRRWRGLESAGNGIYAGGAKWLGLVNRTGPGRRQADVNYICGLAHRGLWSGNSLYCPDSSAGVGQTDYWTDCRLLPDNPHAGRRSGWSVVAVGYYGGSALGVQRLSHLLSGNLLSAGGSGDVGRNGGEFVGEIVAEDLPETVAFAQLEPMPTPRQSHFNVRGL